MYVNTYIRMGGLGRVRINSVCIVYTHIHTYYKVINNTNIIDMPNELISWLLAFKADTGKTPQEKRKKNDSKRR